MGDSNDRRRGAWTMALAVLLCIAVTAWIATTTWAFSVTRDALGCEYVPAYGGLPRPGTLRANAEKIVECRTFIGANSNLSTVYPDPYDLLVRRDDGRSDIYYGLGGGSRGYLHVANEHGKVTNVDIQRSLPSRQSVR